MKLVYWVCPPPPQVIEYDCPPLAEYHFPVNRDDSSLRYWAWFPIYIVYGFCLVIEGNFFVSPKTLTSARNSQVPAVKCVKTQRAASSASALTATRNRVTTEPAREKTVRRNDGLFFCLDVSYPAGVWPVHRPSLATVLVLGNCCGWAPWLQTCTSVLPRFQSYRSFLEHGKVVQLEIKRMEVTRIKQHRKKVAGCFIHCLFRV